MKRLATAFVLPIAVAALTLVAKPAAGAADPAVTLSTDPLACAAPVATSAASRSQEPTGSGDVGATSACCRSGPCFGWGSYTVSCCGTTCSASSIGVYCDGWPTWCPDPCAGNGICNDICQNDPDCPHQCVQGASCSNDDDCLPYGSCWGGSCNCPE